MPLASMSNVTSIWGMPRGAGRMPSRMKRPSDLLSPAMGALALEDVDLDARSGCRRRCEKVWLLAVGIVVLRGMIGVGDAAERLDAERQRRDVEQEHVRDVALEDAGLDGGADGDDLVRVHALVGLLAEELRRRSPGPSGMRVWPPTRTTSSTSVRCVTLASSSACLHGLERALDELADELLELGAGERDR